MELPSFLGGSSKKSVLKRISCGNYNTTAARNINVTSYLPGVYNTLTINNFAAWVVPRAIKSTASYIHGKDNIAMFSSYNSSTGILAQTQFDVAGDGFSVYVQYSLLAYYIE